MASNKLFTNIITGTAIIASLTTGGMAGMKVLASRNIDTEVPEVTIPSATPSASPSFAPINIVPVSAIPVVGDNDANHSVSPSMSPTASPDTKFPLASIVPGGRFDDDGDSDDNELEHEDNHESRVNEKIEVEDHEDN